MVINMKEEIIKGKNGNQVKILLNEKQRKGHLTVLQRAQSDKCS